MSFHGRFAVAVYCGSRLGADAGFARAADALGEALAEAGCALVYGGAQVGLMGRVADAALKGGAPVLGVIPDGLAGKEIAHAGLTELRVVRTLHERKAVMSTHADAFIALPGGFGTLDELFEALTWRQLGIHGKAFGLLNVGDYFDALLAFVRVSVKAGFLSKEHAELLKVSAEPRELLGQLKA